MEIYQAPPAEEGQTAENGPRVSIDSNGNLDAKGFFEKKSEEKDIDINDKDYQWIRNIREGLEPSKDYTDRDLQLMLEDTRLNVQISFPWLAYLINTVPAKMVRNNKITAHAVYDHTTDDFYMEFSADLMVTVSEKQRNFVFAHEYLHVLLEHGPLTRDWQGTKDFDKDVFHEACDYLINYILAGWYKSGDDTSVRTNNKITKRIELLKGILIDERFVGMNVFQIYEELKKDGKKGGGSRGGMPMEAPENLIREHSKNVKKKVAASVQSMGGSGMGDGTCPIQDAIAKNSEPVVDYRDRLHALHAQCDGGDSITYAVPNSRYSGEDSGIIMPSRYGHMVNLFVGYDTSGSMSAKDYEEVSRAIYDVARQYENWRVVLASCDTQAHIIGEFDGDSLEDMTDIDFSIVSCGGTDMKPMADYARERVEQGEQLDGCIIVTDGYIPTNVDAAFSKMIPNLVLVTSGGNKSLELQNAEVVHIMEGVTS